MKTLSETTLIDIFEMFGGKVYAFVPVIRESWIGLGIAVANEKGYSPISSLHYSTDKWNEAQMEADRLNMVHLGLTERTALDIVASTL